MSKKREKRKKFEIKKYVSPIFLVMLAISFAMWYLTKLSANYTDVEVPVIVDVDGNKFRVTCIAEGPGYRLMAHRSFGKSRVNLRFEEVDTTPSVVNPGRYVISPSSLQRAISLRNTDIKIVGISDIPEIKRNSYQ